MTQYRDVPMNFGDASLVVAARNPQHLYNSQSNFCEAQLSAVSLPPLTPSLRGI